MAALTAALVIAGSASAASFSVNSTGQQADAQPGNGVCATDQGTCTLRAALGEANALLGPDSVTVPAGTYPVTTWSPAISQSLTLRGTDGSRATILDSGGTAQNWSITGGGNVTFEGFTVTGLNGGFTAVVVNGPDTTFRDVSIDGNRATGSVAGLRIGAGQVNMTRSAVTGNLAATSSTQTLGGGIAVMTAGSLTLNATTVAGNRIQSSGSSAWGGGIYSAGPLVMRHVTLTGNSVQTASAANYGGNLYLGQNVQGTVRDSIIVDGTTSSGQARNCMLGTGATLNVTGKNVYEPLGIYSCEFPAANVAGTSTALTTLGDHGGTGRTAVPLTNSVAVDAASGCPDDGLDQRGVKAPSGDACDIGAAELAADLRVELTSAPGPVVPGSAVFQTAVLTNDGFDTATGTTLSIDPPSGLSILAVSSGACDDAGTCLLGTLSPGMSRTVSFTAAAPASGSLITTVTGRSDAPDPSPENAVASIATEVLGAPVITKLRAIGKLRSGQPGRIGLTLTRDATVRIVISRLDKGRRKGGKCRTGLKKGKRCQIVKRVGLLTARLKAGPGTLPLPRRLGGRKLVPGRYRLVATATSSEGLEAKAVRTTVKVLKPRKR